MAGRFITWVFTTRMGWVFFGMVLAIVYKAMPGPMGKIFGWLSEAAFEFICLLLGILFSGTVGVLRTHQTSVLYLLQLAIMLGVIVFMFKGMASIFGFHRAKKRSK